MQGIKFNRSHFERRIINPVILEINKKTNFNLNVSKKKNGAKVENYEFTWSQKEKTHADNYSKENTNKIKTSLKTANTSEIKVSEKREKNYAKSWWQRYHVIVRL